MSDPIDRHEMAAAMTQLKEQREQQTPSPDAEAVPPKRAPRAEPVELDDDGDGPTDRAWTIDDAYDVLQSRKDRAGADSEDPAPAAPAARGDDGDGDADRSGPTWTTEEVGRIQSLQQAEAAWRQDAAAFAQLKQRVNLTELERTDKAKAVMVRQQLAEVEKDLRQSLQSIEGEKAELAGKVHGHRLQTEQAKLQKALPNFDKGALKTYLVGAGFSADEVRQAGDARLVILAEKARLWDEQQSGQRKVPRMRKGAKSRTAQPAQPSDRVSQLRARLEKSGSMDDALALLRAQRQQRRASR